MDHSSMVKKSQKAVAGGRRKVKEGLPHNGGGLGTLMGYDEEREC